VKIKGEIDTRKGKPKRKKKKGGQMRLKSHERVKKTLKHETTERERDGEEGFIWARRGKRGG